MMGDRQDNVQIQKGRSVEWELFSFSWALFFLINRVEIFPEAAPHISSYVSQARNGFTWLLINQSQAKKNGVAVPGQAKFDSALWSRAALSEVGLVYEHDEGFFRKENVKWC